SRMLLVIAVLPWGPSSLPRVPYRPGTPRSGSIGGRSRASVLEQIGRQAGQRDGALALADQVLVHPCGGVTDAQPGLGVGERQLAAGTGVAERQRRSGTSEA